MRVHVLPGDAQVEQFVKTGLDGKVVVCREALVDGDVRAGNLEEFWKVREEFLSSTYPESETDYKERVASEFEKLLDLPANAEVNLWFEYELFCQVNMWFCIWLLRESPAEIYRVAPILQRKDHAWDGFGGMSAEDLQACYDERLKFSDEDLALGVELWTAYQNRDYDRLKALSTNESACFPYLKEACEAELEKEFRPKQVLRDLRRDGVEDFGEMFAAFRERAGVYGLGDTQVRRILNEI
ncbi:MAG TPA: DUF1835 domain-containing protein [Pyrinomonadaceae bacterium]